MNHMMTLNFSQSLWDYESHSLVLGNSWRCWVQAGAKLRMFWKSEERPRLQPIHPLTSVSVPLISSLGKALLLMWIQVLLCCRGDRSAGQETAHPYPLPQPLSFPSSKPARAVSIQFGTDLWPMKQAQHCIVWTCGECLHYVLGKRKEE